MGCCPAKIMEATKTNDNMVALIIEEILELMQQNKSLTGNSVAHLK